ncbi:MAG: hypothetical protein ABI741_10570 [Ferruginibacter sp.]
MTITNKPNWILIIGIPFIIFLTCFLITLTQGYQSNQQLLSNAVIADLLITSPLVYLFLIRKTSVSKFTAIRVFVIGVLVAGLIINTHSNSLLHFIKTWISPVIEAVIVFVIIRKFYTADKAGKQTGNTSIDFLAHCRTIMYKVTGNVRTGNIFSAEIAVFYYAFIGRRDKHIDYHSKFTSYRENSITLILYTILALFLVETIGVHFLLSIWNRTAAWIISGLSLYTCIQVFAHIKAIKARPIIITATSLEIHNGLAGDAYIDLNNIERFELTKKFPVDRNAIKISLLKTLEGHNCVVYLKQPIEVTKIFGIKKWADTVLFFVDKPKDFSVALHSKLSGLTTN